MKEQNFEHTIDALYGCGGVLLNHNEATAEDDSAEAKMEDLPVSEEEDEKIKSGGPSYTTVGLLLNHNETTAEDDASELDDLNASNDDEIKGGPLKRIRIGGMSFGEEGAE